MTIPKPPDSEYGSWEQYTGEDGQKYWQFRDTYGRVWDISPNWKVNQVYPDDPENGIYNVMDYEDVEGNLFQDWDDENGHHSEYWDPEKEWFYPYGPGTDYPDVEPMDRTSNALETPSPYGEMQEHHAEGLPGLEYPAVEHHAKGYGLPDPVEEATPAPPVPGPEVQDNFVKDYGFPGLVEGPPQAEQYPPAEPPVLPVEPPPEQPPADQYPPAVPASDPFPPYGEVQEHFAKDHIPDLVEEAAPAPPAPGLSFLNDEQRQAEERERSEQEQNPNPPPPAGDQIPPAEQPVPPTDPNVDREPPEETPGPSFEDLGIQEHHAKGYSNIPDLVEEPAPVPPHPPYGEMQERLEFEPDPAFTTEQASPGDPLFPTEPVAYGPAVEPDGVVADPYLAAYPTDPSLTEPYAADQDVQDQGFEDF